MPEMNEFCAWCGTEYCHHNFGSRHRLCPTPGVGYGFSTTQTFASFGTIILDQVPDGCSVEYCVDKDGVIVEYHPSLAVKSGWVITHTLFVGSMVVLLGWKIGDVCPPWAWSKDDTRAYAVLLKNAKMEMGWWQGKNLHIVRVLSFGPATITAQQVSTSSGMACACCHNFNNYAQPNYQGKHVCFSCKSGGRHLYMEI